MLSLSRRSSIITLLPYFLFQLPSSFCSCSSHFSFCFSFYFFAHDSSAFIRYQLCFFFVPHPSFYISAYSISLSLSLSLLPLTSSHPFASLPFPSLMALLIQHCDTWQYTRRRRHRRRTLSAIIMMINDSRCLRSIMIRTVTVAVPVTMTASDLRLLSYLWHCDSY